MKLKMEIGNCFVQCAITIGVMVDLSGRTRVCSTNTPTTERTNVEKLSKSEPARTIHIEEAMEGSHHFLLFLFFNLLRTFSLGSTTFTEIDACRTIIFTLWAQSITKQQQEVQLTRSNTQQLTFSGNF